MLGSSCNSGLVLQLLRPCHTTWPLYTDQNFVQQHALHFLFAILPQRPVLTDPLSNKLRRRCCTESISRHVLRCFHSKVHVCQEPKIAPKYAGSCPLDHLRPLSRSVASRRITLILSASASRGLPACQEMPGDGLLGQRRALKRISQWVAVMNTRTWYTGNQSRASRHVRWVCSADFGSACASSGR